MQAGQLVFQPIGPGQLRLQDLVSPDRVVLEGLIAALFVLDLGLVFMYPIPGLDTQMPAIRIIQSFKFGVGSGAVFQMYELPSVSHCQSMDIARPLIEELGFRYWVTVKHFQQADIQVLADFTH